LFVWEPNNLIAFGSAEDTLYLFKERTGRHYVLALWIKNDLGAAVLEQRNFNHLTSISRLCDGNGRFSVRRMRVLDFFQEWRVAHDFCAHFPLTPIAVIAGVHVN